MSTKGSFRNLKVWAKAHQLVLLIYEATQSFPGDELYGLTSQMRRAAVSVPANIAEGYKRKGQQDKTGFYNIAQASLEELRYFIILSQDLNYNMPKEAEKMSEEVSRMLEMYVTRIKENQVGEPDFEY
ncbi:MAG: four helix bundle protein [Bacteroidales bacterium]|jgi:four helix bundle protein|nr:four helix bundle protein [Bacteroidales bacterium]